MIKWYEISLLISRFLPFRMCLCRNMWAESSEFVSSSIPSLQILTAHAQPFRGARDLAFCLTVPLDSLLVWASSGGSGETARMLRLAWTFAARIGDKYQIRLTRPMCKRHSLWCRYGVGSNNFCGITTKQKQIYICTYSALRVLLDFLKLFPDMSPIKHIWIWSVGR